MKKFLSALIIFGVLIFSANCRAADYQSVDITYLSDIVGSWYDADGELVLTISNDYKINDHEIVSVGFVGDTSSMYKIILKDDNEYKYVEVAHSGSEKNSEHEMLVVDWADMDNAFALRRTKNPRYFESIGGIYLGMNENEVLKLYGNPSSKEHFNRFMKNWIWKYDGIGLEVSVYGEIVTEIKISPYGNRLFDGSGLSAKSSQNDFVHKYNTNVSRRGNLNIGHGEFINIRNDGVTLGILTSGYVF